MKILGRSAKILSILLILALIPSCAVLDWFGGKVSDEEVKELDSDITTAKPRDTRYDTSLKRFGKLLAAYNIQPLRVQSKIISNQTADQSLPSNISKMLITAVNKIGKEVTYLPYDPNYIISEATTGGNIHRILPQVVIAGGITEYDKNLIEKKRELKTEAGIEKGQWGSEYDQDYGLGYDSGESVSRIALDLHLFDYITQASIANVQSSNAINIRKTKLGWAVGAFFAGCGLTFDYSLKKQQGKYYAIRLLVELSVLEVLGKYFDVPYWRVLPGAIEDEALVGRLYEEFGDLTNDEQIAYIKEYLFFHGVDNLDRTSFGVTAQDEAAVKTAMKKYNCNTNTDLFIKLWKTVPIKEARKRNRTYTRDLNRKQRAQEAEAAQLPPVVEQPPVAPVQPEVTQPIIEAAVVEEVGTSSEPTASPEEIVVVSEPEPVKARVEPVKSNKEAPVGFGDTDW